MSNEFTVLDPIPPEAQKPLITDYMKAASMNQTLSNRWGFPDVFCNGFVAVPTLFLQTYANLKPYALTPGEAMFVLELMSFKWGTDPPHPGYHRIAARMNVSDKMVRRYAQSLEVKGYLRRRGRKNLSNEFDLSGLFRALHIVAADYDEGRKPGE